MRKNREANLLAEFNASKQNAFNFVTTMLVPAYAKWGYRPGISFADLIEPLMEIYIRGSGVKNLDIGYIHTAVLTCIAEKETLGLSGSTSNTQLRLLRDITQQLASEHDRAERGYSGHHLPVQGADELEYLQERVRRIKSEKQANRRRGEIEMEQREARRREFLRELGESDLATVLAMLGLVNK